MPPPSWRRAWPLFALATAVGLIFLVQWPLQAVRDYRTFRVYEPTTCTVLSSRSIHSTTGNGISNRVRGLVHDYYVPEVTFRFTAAGRSFTASGYDNYDGWASDASVLVSFDAGRQVPCWFDPAHPERAVVARTFSWAYFGSGVIPLALTLIPLNFLLVALRTRLRPVALKTTTGTVYAVRLAPEFTNRQSLVWRTAIAVALAAGLAAYLWYLVEQHGVGGAIGELGAFFLGFVVFDGYIFWLAWQSLRVAGLQDPTVEVDREPAHPGDRIAVAVALPGPLTFRDLKLTLVCSEQGPRGSRKPVVRSVLSEAAGTVAKGAWLTRTATVTIPADASPSEREGERVTTWAFTLRARAGGGGSLAHEYPFRVLASDRQD